MSLDLKCKKSTYKKEHNKYSLLLTKQKSPLDYLKQIRIGEGIC